MWVARLQAGVARHLTEGSFRFVCLSDVDVPCERIPLEHDWPGWWAKCELLRLRGPVLGLDLDSAIVGDLTDIARVAFMGGFTMLRDFYRHDGLGSGVTAWSEGDITAADLYDIFTGGPDEWMHSVGGRGDQGFVEEAAFTPAIMRWQDALPGQIVSYKVHCRNGIPPHARVVCLHGQPKFADMPVNDPVRLAWEMAA